MHFAQELSVPLTTPRQTSLIDSLVAVLSPVACALDMSNISET
jgi:hypothetical protein